MAEGFGLGGGLDGQARRILEAPVEESRWAGEDRAALPGVVANGDHPVEVELLEVLKALRALL